MITYTGPHGTRFTFNNDLGGDLIIVPPGVTDEQSSVIPVADVVDFLLQEMVIRRTVDFLEDPDLIDDHVTHSRIELHATFEIGAPRKPPDGH